MTALVFWHGWGMPPQVWDELRNKLRANLEQQLAQQYPLHTQAPALPGYAGAPPLADHQATALIDFLMKDITSPVALCAWSLGAMLAMLAAQRYPEKISHLILFAPTPSFVSRQDWLHGVPPSLLTKFSHQLVLSPSGTLKSFITLINQGDQHVRRIMRHLNATLLHCTLTSDSSSSTLPSTATLEAGLTLLAELDCRPAITHIKQPCLLLQGARDTLIPGSAAAWLAQALPDATLDILPQAAHAPFLSDPDYCATSIAHFLHAKSI